ncbi:MAG: pyridoxamine 5'-phosphate oxidase family protein [Deltaproteobacteria bacterium]|jgi:predicted pyridoxine 5'-phosphate oxidase superfamily flavin-nucleotide-binding protein|nr:pyridoxamine 5'-phosphate oxidase family protein [Deltaproteobacteria bacterium]
MDIISQEIREFVSGKVGWVATVGPQGVPNLAPKGTVEVLDGETIVFADFFSLKTRSNLEKNPKVAVAVIEASPPSGFQFKGQAELVSSGDLYDAVAAKIKAAVPQLPFPKCVVKIKVTEIYSLSPGPQAGQKIA